MSALEFPTGRCGFCGATGTNSCREFYADVDPHSERPSASLFADALDGRTFGPVDTLFVLELDGPTFTSYDQYCEYLDAEAEIQAENGWLRAAETNDQYAWEDEQDRLRANAFGF